jgi:hypothetical protein
MQHDQADDQHEQTPAGRRPLEAVYADLNAAAAAARTLRPVMPPTPADTTRDEA